MEDKNPNSILFLYEGKTDFEFYRRLFDIYLPKRKIRFHHSNLKGIHNINAKVKRKIVRYLDEKRDENFIYVIVAHDREGRRTKPSALNLELLMNDEKIKQTGRISSIMDVLATQDIESWFLKDLDGIYKYLRVPKKKRTKKYKHTEFYNNEDLSKIFYQFGKHYQKGEKVEGLVENLDLTKIYKATPELVNMMEYIHTLI